jgi:hypothetical protein
VKKSFANKFNNNYSSSISRDIISIREKKDVDSNLDKISSKTKTQKAKIDIFTNENIMISNTGLNNFYTFRSINYEDEEITETESIILFDQDNNNNNEIFNFPEKEKEEKNNILDIEKNETNISNINTNYGSVIIYILILLFF